MKVAFIDLGVMGHPMAGHMQEALEHDLPLELTRLLDGFYKEVQEMGGGRWDTSSLLATRLKR